MQSFFLTCYQSSNIPRGQRVNPICLILRIEKMRQEEVKEEGHNGRPKELGAGMWGAI